VIGIDLEKNLKVTTLMDCYSPVLTDKQRRIMDLYYNEDYSLSEIAEHERTTRQAVHDIIRRSEEHLFVLEKKVRLAEKTAAYIKFADKVTRLSDEIIDFCAASDNPRRIIKRAEYLKETAAVIKAEITGGER